MPQIKHLTQSIIVAAAKMIDDSPARGQRRVAPADAKWREPSHHDLTVLFEKCELAHFDPKKELGKSVGKAKRLREVLTSALNSSEEEKGGRCLTQLIGQVQGCGGFLKGAENFIGEDAIKVMAAALRNEGFVLTPDGQLLPQSLDSLNGRELTNALRAYVRRTVRGGEDAALIAGTSKDLLEATAKHFLKMRRVPFEEKANFPKLMTSVFSHLAMSDTSMSTAGHYGKMLEVIADMAFAVNALRNKEGTGHGRLWLTELTPQQARAAAQFSGVIAEFLLDLLQSDKDNRDG